VAQGRARSVASVVASQASVYEIAPYPRASYNESSRYTHNYHNSLQDQRRCEARQASLLQVAAGYRECIVGGERTLAGSILLVLADVERGATRVAFLCILGGAVGMYFSFILELHA
jgi:hypothetical protein